jgi:hypothetical protein
LTYSTTLKTTRMTDIVTAIGSGGKLELGTAGMASILATISLESTAGTVSGGVLTFSSFPKTATFGNSGTLAVARIRTSANVDVVTGLTVGLSGSHINVDTLDATSGQDVELTSFTLTHG